MIRRQRLAEKEDGEVESARLWKQNFIEGLFFRLKFVSHRFKM